MVSADRIGAVCGLQVVSELLSIHKRGLVLPTRRATGGEWRDVMPDEGDYLIHGGGGIGRRWSGKISCR